MPDESVMTNIPMQLGEANEKHPPGLMEEVNRQRETTHMEDLTNPDPTPWRKRVERLKEMKEERERDRQRKPSVDQLAFGGTSLGPKDLQEIEARSKILRRELELLSLARDYVISMMRTTEQKIPDEEEVKETCTSTAPTEKKTRSGKKLGRPKTEGFSSKFFVPSSYGKPINSNLTKEAFEKRVGALKFLEREGSASIRQIANHLRIKEQGLGRTMTHPWFTQNGAEDYVLTLVGETASREIRENK